MSPHLWIACFALGAVGLSVPARSAETDSPPPRQFFAESLRPLAEKYCFDCHSGANAEGGVGLDKYATAEAVLADRKPWERTLKMLRSRGMPPADTPRPNDAEYEAAVEWLDGTLHWVDCSGPIDPGRVTIRRLNRAEYSNTIRDLLGVEFDPTELPADDVGYGFDNIGDVLTLPPLLMEKYLAAAEQIAGRTIESDKPNAKPEDLPEPHRRLVFVRPGENLSPADAARQVLQRLATRAFRRPATAEEVDRLVGLAESVRAEGDTFESGIELALQAVLVSPHFLFRIERDPEPNNPQTVRALDDYELATRLSYFLWSSMPDDELFKLAVRGELRPSLDAQVRRMMADPKSRALVENFAGQWLELRNLDRVAPDRKQFPRFNDALRQAMRTEALLCFEAVMRENRSILDFIDADYTFLNARLARHYGIPGVEGDEFRRVSLRGEKPDAAALLRGGVITQAAMLTVTSNPTRTSPVKRGRWVLENILGQPPPDPPPNVPMLKEDKQAVASGSLRQRLEQHRADPSCSVCHRDMDALGFALENYDPVGAWRVRDGEFPIEPAGELPGGLTFDGPAQLKTLLREEAKDKFPRCLTEKMLTYALGRGLEYYDRCAVDRIAAAVAADDYRFSSLVLEIVRSEPFQKRRGKETE